MGEVDSIGEIMELAVAREEEANLFYKDLAKQTKDPTMRIVFEKFADEELEHKAKLELEVMKAGKVVTTAEIPVNFKIEDYIENTEHIPDMNYEQLLLMAIAKEKRSVRFYIELAALVQEKDAREALISLAEEEAKHEARFQMEYDYLSPSKG
jgi:rubrerythrin